MSMQSRGKMKPKTYCVIGMSNATIRVGVGLLTGEVANIAILVCLKDLQAGYQLLMVGVLGGGEVI